MEELVAKAKDGNVEAYEVIINELKPVLYRIARARLDNEEDISDALNETIFIAYQNLKKLKHNEYFKTWIVRILINKCNKIYKLNKRNLQLIEKTSFNKDIVTYYDNSLEKVDDKLSFETLIKNLNYDERIVFVLYFYLNYDTTEISKILGINANTIKSRLRRGKEKISNILNGGGRYDK